jgi:pimeloyl-ACP methyl ester carboxylesterase
MILIRRLFSGRNKFRAGSRAFPPRYLLLSILAPIVLMSSSFFALRWCEYALTFQPDRYQPGNSWALPERAEDVKFLNRDHETLDAWFVHSSARTPLAVEPAPTIIFFHGQGGNISNVGWLGEKLASLGFDVLLVDYRGYGKSEGRIRDEQDMYADADAAYDYVVNQRGTPADRVILYGHSLGTTAVVDLASRRSCAAIILESGLSCARDIASVRLPWMPNWLRALGTNKFESTKKLSSVFCPVLVAHGEPDNVVPTEEGRALYLAANRPKRLIIVPGADHGVAGFGGDKYLLEVSEFIRYSLRGQSRAS